MSNHAYPPHFPATQQSPDSADQHSIINDLAAEVPPVSGQQMIVNDLPSPVLPNPQEQMIETGKAEPPAAADSGLPGADDLLSSVNYPFDQQMSNHDGAGPPTTPSTVDMQKRVEDLEKMQQESCQTTAPPERADAVRQPMIINTPPPPCVKPKPRMPDYDVPAMPRPDLAPQDQTAPGAEKADASILWNGAYSAKAAAPGVALCAVITIGVAWLSWTYIPRGQLTLIFVGAVAAIWALPLITWLYRQSSYRYCVTSSNLQIERGWLYGDPIHLERSQVLKATVSATLLQKLLGVGTVVIEAATPEPERFTFDGVREPKKVVQLLGREWSLK